MTKKVSESGDSEDEQKRRGRGGDGDGCGRRQDRRQTANRTRGQRPRGTRDQTSRNKTQDTGEGKSTKYQQLGVWKDTYGSAHALRIIAKRRYWAAAIQEGPKPRTTMRWQVSCYRTADKWQMMDRTGGRQQGAGVCEQER